MRGFALIAAFVAATAMAQLRIIPDDAERAEIRHVEQNIIELNGKQERLAPGAQIRDQANRVIVPAALEPGVLVRYLRDASGAVSQVWILTPEEAAR